MPERPELLSLKISVSGKAVMISGFKLMAKHDFKLIFVAHTHLNLHIKLKDSSDIIDRKK